MSSRKQSNNMNRPNTILRPVLYIDHFFPPRLSKQSHLSLTDLPACTTKQLFCTIFTNVKKPSWENIHTCVTYTVIINGNKGCVHSLVLPNLPFPVSMFTPFHLILYCSVHTFSGRLGVSVYPSYILLCLPSLT